MTKIARQTQSCLRYKDDGSFSCKEIMLVRAEIETRAHGVGISRELYLYPRPLEGVFGVAPSNQRTINEKRQSTDCLPFR